jgi:hypothetical protein
MKRTGKFQLGLSLILAAGVMAPESVRACAVCYGESDAAIAKGMTMGMLMMLGLVVVLIWGGLGACFIYLGRRSARVNAAVSDAPAAVVESRPVPETADMSR